VVPVFILALALGAALPPDQIVHQPYVELMTRPDSAGYSPETLKTLRAGIERERDEKIDNARKLETQQKEDLAAARRELASLNKAAAVDTAASGERRRRLHPEIAALERSIRETVQEREHTIPATYETQLAKVWLLEHWPVRRAEILYRIESGRSRDRRHGDVEDIGYRQLARNPEKDIEVGERAARQMAAGGWLPLEFRDQEVQLYVRRLGESIASSSDLKVPLHVSVLDSTQPRAIALPGGFLYVTSGVLSTARTESELAGVLSREIARMAAQHATRGSKRSFVSKVFMPVMQTAAGIFSGGLHPGAYYGIGYGMQGLSGLMEHVLNGSNEAYQKEADQLGVQYAWKAGYDPRGFVSFLDSLIGNASADLVGREPPLPQRLLNLFSEIAYLPPLDRPLVNSVEFERARQRVLAASQSGTNLR
jgi:hypothetical protein